jgi:hypothetical protein
MTKRAHSTGERVGSPKDCKAVVDSTSRKEAKACEVSLNVVERKAMEWIVKFVSDPDNKHQILYCKAQLEAGLCDRSEQHDIEQKKVFHHTFTTFKCLPKYYEAEFLVQHCSLSKGMVDLLDVGGQGQLRQAFTFITGVSDFASWPPALHRIELLTDFLKKQVDLLGNRHRGFAKSVDGQGKIDWHDAMAYKLKWSEAKDGEGARVIQISHVQAVGVPITSCIITSAFQVAEPWDDMRANFTGDAIINPVLASFFKADSPFKQYWGKAHFKEQAAFMDEQWDKRQNSCSKSNGILHSVAANARAQWIAKSKARVPAHKMSTPLKMP